MTEKDLKNKLKVLKKQNDILKRENKYLKSLINSKRFKFAEKMATSYNGVFPKNTRRRNIMEKAGRAGKRVVNAKRAHNEKKITNTISKLAGGYERAIVLNSVPWDLKLKQRPHHLAEEFRKLGYFVVYLEYDNVLQNFRTIEKGLITVNSEKYLMKLPEICKNCYLLSPNNMPTNYKTLKSMVDNGYKFIYDYLDEFHEDISGDLSIQMEVWDKLKSLKPILCIATAKRLYKELEKHLGKKQKIVMASNAVIIEHFDYKSNKTSNPPYDIASVVKKKKPVIGFYGALAPWIDFPLLNEIARKHPEWEFVYLGVDYNGAAAELEKMANVHNLGAKNYELLPKYAKFFNCALIPFRKGEIAKATSPVKLFEYMAAGLPVVCTRDLDECNGYDFVYMSKNDKEFEENINKAIKDFNNKKCREALLKQAQENTWEKRVELIDRNLGK